MKVHSLPSVLVALGTADASPESDAALLERFTAARDQAAFTTLVRRYSRAVWRVARTRCRSAATAEDVFQAAFVVLSRKAKSIRSGAALAGWLHRTAHRLAVRAAKKERHAVPLPAHLPTSADPLDALTARELLAAVDDEMAKLSDAERSVLVLCGIDGLTNDDAARRLGCTTGSVKGRLERARAKLRTRLDARGLTLPAVALGLIGGPTAAAVQAALTIPRGGAIPPGVERLIAEGLSMKGTMAKAMVLILFGAVLTTGGFSGRDPTSQANAAPVPKKAEPEKLVLWSEPLDAAKGFAATHGIWTPDGKHVLTGGQVPGAKGGEWPGELRVWDADTGKLTHTHRGELSYVTRPTTVAITPDGKTLAAIGYGNAQPRQFTLDVFDWGEEKPRVSLRLNKPATGVLLAADGKTVFTLDMRGDLTARDLKTEKLLWTSALGQELAWGLAFWNDGKALLVADEGGNVRRFDAATGKVLPLLGKYDIKSLSLSASKDETRVAVGGYGGKGPVVIDCKDHEAIDFRSMKLATTAQANQVSLSPDGKHLAVACSGQENVVKVFDAATGDLLAEGKEHTDRVSGVQFSPDGKRLLTVGADAIKVWNVAELMKPEVERTKPAPDTRRRNAPVPKAEPREGVILLSSFSEHHSLEVVKPDGEAVPVAKADGAFNPWLAKLSADGKRAAIPEPALASGPGLNGWAKFRIRLLDLEAKEFDPKMIAEEAYLPTVAWTANGNRVFGSHVDPEKLKVAPKQGELLPFQSWVYDPATQKKTPVKLPPEHAVVGVSPDGKTLLTRTTEFGNPKQVLYLTPLSTLKPEKFGDAPVIGLDAPRFSPDGKQLLWTRRANDKSDPATAGVFVTDVATKKETRVSLPKEIEASVHHACWSPNGKRIALLWYEQVPRPKNQPVPAGPGPAYAARLTVCDADGSNPKVILKRDGDGGTITGLDWR